jgi:prolyl oligopeptidase
VIEPELPRLFKRIPRLIYGIRAIPSETEASTASNAQPPTPDGSRPGWFNLNTYEPEKQVRYDKEALVLHEAVPGHVFQLSLALELPELPEFRKSAPLSAYTEGWALYVEVLGAELGVYKDPTSRFGQLDSERFRAVRLVVDTGMHALGWSRAQAVDFFQTHAPAESVAEIDRYISWPAQALSYKMGQLKIVELRRRAETELGAKFDVREFHDAVLRNGALPMEMLEETVNAYIAQAKR